MPEDPGELLLSAVKAKGQASVARELGYSPTAICLVLKGKYGAGSDKIHARVAEVYGVLTLDCPVLGEIPINRCADERRTPFSASSPQRVAIFRACRECRQHGPP